MRIHCYMIGWQIADTIKFSISHYKAFCERVVFYDNYSTDDTVKIALECGAEIRYFGEPGVLNDQHYLDVKNHCWKESDADWVIVVDDDEILYSDWSCVPCAEGTAVKCLGVEVCDYAMPQKYFVEMTNGIPNPNYDKIAMWKPKEVTEINYVFGCHVAKPQGNVQIIPQRIFMLHYRSVGGPDRYINRHALYRTKEIAEINKRWGLGSHYWNQTDAERRQWWLENYDRRFHISEMFRSIR